MVSKVKNTKSDYELLHFSSLTELGFWDYHTLSNKASIQSQYSLIELDKVLTHRKQFETIDDEKEYKRCRVQLYGKGIILRDRIKGKEIKTKKQQFCKQNDFLVAEIDAKFGGYGIVPRELEDAIVSSHYFLFEINLELLLPAYLEILVKCDGFSRQVKATGSTNYAAIRPYHVLTYLIPLPSLEEQKRIVANYNASHSKANQLNEEASQLNTDIEDYLYKQLGIQKTRKKEKVGLLQTLNFSEIERWSYGYITNFIDIEKNFQGNYPLVPLKEFIVSYQYGLSAKAHVKPEGIPILRMNNINEASLSTVNLKYLSTDLEAIREKYLLHEGDLLFNRTNSKELVGKTAVFESKEEYTFASYLIRVVLNQSLADVHYINYLFNSSILQFQKDLTSRQITGQANINSTEMQDFLFPFPPLILQKKIASEISSMKEKIDQLKKKAETLRDTAIQEFEQEVFAQ